MFGLPALLESEEAAAWQVHELIGLLGLDAYRNKFAGELSTGSRRMVDLAMVVAPPAERPAARRAVVRHRAARGRGARAGAAGRAGPPRLRARRHRARHAAHPGRQRPAARARHRGTSSSDGLPEDVGHAPQVVASYLGNNTAAGAARRAPALRPHRLSDDPGACAARRPAPAPPEGKDREGATAA
jgi:branched-chain amino acid transport system ATP-binding protein